MGDDEAARDAAEVFGLRDGHIAFLSHCGSRGVGHRLASGQFKALEEKFATWRIPLPGEDKQLVYAPLGTPEADHYLDDMALGANFATVNHMLINALVLEAFQEVIPGYEGSTGVLHQPQHCAQGIRQRKTDLGASQGSHTRFSSGSSRVEADAV